MSDLCFQANAQVSVPEPNSIAVIVTAVGGLATLLRRRKPRHGRGQAFRPT
ncbi:MAG: PEP-CTERM sorting domain-containing protein [Acetobacteraceae bacterium]